MAFKPKVTVVFDDRSQPHTTGGYCLRALREMAHVTHMLPKDIASYDPASADLLLQIDDGYDYPWPDGLHPSGYWAIDTHMNYDFRLQHARRFDRVFCAQKPGAEQMRRDGVDAVWMPLACDPEFHGKQDAAKVLDLCMVGRMMPGHPRSDLAALLRAYYPATFIGSRTHHELGVAYSESRIAFNRSIGGDVNMRVFEAMCAGAMLLTDHIEGGLTDLFQPGKHLVTYRTADELLESVNYYLARDSERETIGEAGRQEVLAKHTYAHRMREVLAAFDLSATRRRKARPKPSTPEPDPERAKTEAVINSSGAGARVAVVIRTPRTYQSEIERSYHDHARPEVLSRIPLGARFILDIGCAAGRLGEALRQRADQAAVDRTIVIGVEANAGVAERATERLDAVLVGDIERMLAENPEQLLESLRAALPASKSPASAAKSRRRDGGASRAGKRGAQPEAPPEATTKYDCIVMADVLEHLREPARVLEILRDLLTEDGALVLSVPNVGHREILQGLSHGRWTYLDAGLLDRTHLRFFTRRDLEQTLFRAGFEVAAIASNSSPEYHDWVEHGRPQTLKFGNITLADVEASDADALFTVQWLVTARKRQVSNHGLTSVIILTRNQLAYTRACVESIRRHTREPYELIFVDNASDDDTPKYLESLCGVTIIRNEQNLGFPKGCNQGIAEARGENILLLNNDVVVTEGWLTRLLDALYSAEDVGAVGPRSHGTIGLQQCGGQWPDVERVDDYAWDMARANAGRRMPIPMLVGFCFLARNSALTTVGALDERFGIGMFEDNDLSLRFLRAGFRMLCVCDAYVHHHANTTFKGEGFDMGAQFRLAEAQFLAKWTDSALSASISTAGPATEPSNPLPPLSDVPRITACVHAVADADALRACLDSIRPAVDEIIILHSGSHERCSEVVEEYNARAELVADDEAFFTSRYTLCARATGDWILWMDSNERIPPEYLSTLQELAGNRSERLGGYLFTCRYVETMGEHGIPRAHQVRMIRRHEPLHNDCITEDQILPAMVSAGFQVASTPIEILNFGTDLNSADALERAAAHWKRELGARPNDPFVLHRLGSTLNSLGRWEEAITTLQHAIALFHHDVSSLPKAMADLSKAVLHRSGPRAALDVAADGLALWPQDSELLFRVAELHYLQGNPREACTYYEQVLNSSVSRNCVSVGEGVLSYLTRHGLGVALRAMGRLDDAERALRDALEDNPRHAPSWLCLAEVLLQNSNVEGALIALQSLFEIDPDNADALALRGKIRMERNDTDAARRDLALSIVRNPRNPRSRRIFADLLLRLRQFPEAERELAAVIHLDPRDAGSLSRLAALCTQSQRAGAAIGLYQRALAIQPGEPNIQFGLAMAFKAIGDTAAAAGHLKQIVQSFPDHDEALYEWGAAGVALGDREHARACFQRINQRNPGHVAARSALAALGTTM